MADDAFLLAIAFAIGVYSTALGAGGAFLLTPLLLIRYPDAPPATVAMASLCVVVVSSGLSAVQAVRDRRIDYPVVGVLLAVVVPMAVLGAWATSLVPRREFQIGFAAFMLLMALYLLLPPRDRMLGVPRGWRRMTTDIEGDTFVYKFPLVPSLIAAAGASFISSLAGIGGGPLYTPLAIRVMRLPITLAVPIAHVVITALAISGLALHIATGHIGEPLRDAPWLVVGMLAANPLGRRLNRRLRDGPVVRLLVVGIVLVALRTAWGAW